MSEEEKQPEPAPVIVSLKTGKAISPEDIQHKQEHDGNKPHVCGPVLAILEQCLELALAGKPNHIMIAMSGPEGFQRFLIVGHGDGMENLKLSGALQAVSQQVFLSGIGASKDSFLPPEA